MSNEEFLSPSEQLTAFIDGELTQEESSNLFYDMAVNPQLQEEMRDLVAIRNTFRNSMMIPPENLKHKVMIGAGIVNPTFFNIIRSGGSAWTALLSLIYNRYSISAAILLLFTFSGYLLMNNHNEMNKQSNLATNQIAHNNGIIAKTESVNIVKQSANKVNNISPDVSINKNKFKSIKALSSNTKNHLVVSNSNEGFASNSENESPNFLGSIYPTSSINQDAKFSTLAMKSNRMNLLPNYIIRFLDKISLNFKTNTSATFPSIDIVDRKAPLLNNFSVAILYDLNINNSIGIEVGYENFPMVFENIENDILFKYSQSYNGLCGGIIYNYEFSELFNETNLFPFINSSIGMNQIGVISKLGIGGKYFVNENFSVNPGIDYVLLLYKNQGDVYSTSKLNFNISFGFKL